MTHETDIQLLYERTVNYLYEQLPMFSRLGKEAIKKDLTNTLKLCEASGNPQDQFKSIHIAGTNGKGSVSHMLASILQECGYKVGLYTSPHLVDFRERIRVNGKPVSRELVVDYVARYKHEIETTEPSFFEITVAMAFSCFAEEQVDVAIVETGLGGRLDSTNVITPLLSVITNISYDHMDMLGNTLGAIANEKAGIIKSKVPVVIGQQHPETEKVFFEHAIYKQSTLYYADSMWDLVRTGSNTTHQFYKAVNRAKREMHDINADLQGSYQYHNIKTVLAAVDVLNTSGHWSIPFLSVQRALSRVKKLTGLHGRWEVMQTSPIIVADVAHNIAGMKEVVLQWGQLNAANKHIVIGFVKDKEIEEVLSLLPGDNTYYFCNANIPRALLASELKKKAEQKGLSGNIYKSVADAVAAARNTVLQHDAILITGSFFIVGEAMEYLHANNGMLFPSTLEDHH